MFTTSTHSQIIIRITMLLVDCASVSMRSECAMYWIMWNMYDQIESTSGCISESGGARAGAALVLVNCCFVSTDSVSSSFSSCLIARKYSMGGSHISFQFKARFYLNW
mmetsp:Transcript_13727/g.25822  ORF Transcript_13727/g.25822 Transcript_13727/m.25822 type:complete len:108 (+) Transcript_13727:330-653(+)